MKNLIVPVLAAGLLPAALIAAEQPDEELDVMVVSATLSATALEDAPGSVEVVTADEIAEMGAATVADALEFSVGLSVDGEPGRTKSPSIRGMGSQRTLVLIDGRRWVSGYKNFKDVNQIPVTAIERIEVLRGPSCALYGSDALGGVVNIITRATPEKFTASADVRYGTDSHDDGQQANSSASIGTKIGKLGLMLSTSYHKENSWNRSEPLPEDGDAVDLGSMVGRLSYDFSEEHRANAGFEYITNDREGLRKFPNNQNGLERLRDAEDERLNYFVDYEGQFDDGKRLTVGAYHSQQENEVTMDPYTNLTAEEDAEHSLDQVEAKYFFPLFDSHFITTGVEARHERREDSTGSDEDMDNSSLFVQDEIQISDPLYLVIGGRLDDYSEFGSQMTPRASMVYSLTDNVNLNASYSEGFRAPSISELYVTSWRSQGKKVCLSNEDLEPEESRSYELGVSADFDRISGSLTAFRTDIDQMIVEYDLGNIAGVSTSQHRNISEASMTGLESELSYELSEQFDLTGYLSWLDTEDKDTGEELEGRADFKGGAKLSYHNQQGLKASVRMEYTGQKYYEAGDLGGMTLWYLQMSQKLNKSTSIYGGIDNVFDKNSYDNDSLWVKDPAFYYVGVRVDI